MTNQILATKSCSNETSTGPRGDMDSYLGSMPQVPICASCVATECWRVFTECFPFSEKEKGLYSLLSLPIMAFAIKVVLLCKTVWENVEYLKKIRSSTGI